ncbi:hypothetical protein [Bacillus sp. NPDC094106]|uniref:hypothetical protein n=1 Tax=Bacillus sp. NPDC094106 TaxID=3363949 RepID=UPI0038185CEB
MKKVLFRGQSTTNNHWLYGSLISNYTENQFFIEGEHHHATPVIPETVNQWIGLNENSTEAKEIFEGDFLILERNLIDKNDGFWDSNAGNLMEKYKLDEMIIHILVSDSMEVKYNGYFKRNNEFFTEREYYEEDNDKIFSFRGDGLPFLKYILKKGTRVIGNTIDNPELIPGLQ